MILEILTKLRELSRISKEMLREWEVEKSGKGLPLKRSYAPVGAGRNRSQGF